MGWFSDFGEGVHASFSKLPKRFQLFGKIILWSAIGVFVVATIGEMTYTTIVKALPVSTEDLRSAERKVDLETRQAEAFEASRLVSAKANAQVAMEAATAEAHRISLGLGPKAEPKSSDALSSLAMIATTHLPTILALMFAVYLLPTFAATGEPWRLALNIAAAVILAGLFALMNGISSPSTAQVKVSVASMSVSSASVGLCLMLFGTVLAGFSLYMLRKHEKVDREKSETHM